MSDPVVYTLAAVGLLGLGFGLCVELLHSARHNAPDEGPRVSQREMRSLTARIDAERAANPDRQS